MAAKRKIDNNGRKVLLAVAIARRMLPTNKRLAVKLGCSVRGVETEMRRLLDMIDASSTVSRGSISGSITGHSRIHASRPLECLASPSPSKSRTY